MSGIYQWFTFSRDYVTNIINPKEKNTILEPLTCIIKLAILSFKPKGTKISINNNRISFHEPGLLQGTIRWSQGDGREDLHNLCYPIIKATQWYELTDSNIRNIFVFGKKGIESLSKSYTKNSTTTHSLNHYITIINNSLKNNITPETAETDNKIYQELKNLWNEREICIINNLLVELSQNNKDPEKKAVLINTIDTFLQSKENLVNKILVESATVLI